MECKKNVSPWRHTDVLSLYQEHKKYTPLNTFEENLSCTNRPSLVCSGMPRDTTAKETKIRFCIFIKVGYLTLKMYCPARTEVHEI